jgi:arylmalonate decarboxylase
LTLDKLAVPVVGLIVPYTTAKLPPEALELYPSGIKFIAEPATVSALEESAYARAMELVVPAAVKLKAAGAGAICVRGTSLTFFRGASFNTQLIETIRGETGLPTTTLSTGIVEGLRKVGAKRISVCTAYDERVNERLSHFLFESGFVVEVLEGLQIVEFDAVRQVSEGANS